jgi:uncharacterized membrane protein (UPF0182 family)
VSWSRAVAIALVIIMAMVAFIGSMWVVWRWLGEVGFTVVFSLVVFATLAAAVKRGAD